MKAIKKAYLKFIHWVFAKNLHGTHSPFVYDFLENVVYAKPTDKVQSQYSFINIYQTSIQYYKIEAIIWLGFPLDKQLQNEQTMMCEYDERFPELLEKNEHISMVVMNKTHHSNVLLTYINMIISLNKKPFFIIIDNIHETEHMRMAWKQLMMNPSITVCMDFHNFGIVVLRDGQVKENFKLKLKM